MDKKKQGNIEALKKILENIEIDMPSLKPIVNAFQEILVNRAMLKERLSERQDIRILLPEHSKFSMEEPLLSKEIIASFVDPWGEIVKSVLSTLATAFPNIEADICRLVEAFSRGDINFEHCIVSHLKNKENEINEIAFRLNIRPIILKLILSQILKPFVEKRTENLFSVVKDIPWYRGYCPICGYYPELSFLKGDEGQRWLRCSLCGYEWRFDRMLCPSCERIDDKSRELNYIEGRQYEWVELCINCHRYIVSTDLRQRKGNMTTEIAAIGMVYLDIIAQRKGFSPIADCFWNVVIPES